MTHSKLRRNLSNTQSQLKIEKLSSIAKGNKLKTLEELVVKIGYDAKHRKEVEDILKNKDLEIVALMKQLKFPSTKDPQTKEMIENE